jgi:hypothetical protein
MRLPRLTIRKWMMIMAIVAVMTSYGGLSYRMWRLAGYHRQQAFRLARERGSWHRRHVGGMWHRHMEQRYLRAIWFPWRAFEPEPRPF